MASSRLCGRISLRLRRACCVGRPVTVCKSSSVYHWSEKDESAERL